MLSEWSQQALVRHVREGTQYGNKMRERCRTTGVQFETVVSGLKTSLDPRVLDQLAHYCLKKDLVSASDSEIIALIEDKLGREVNYHIPDVTTLFAEQLRMDMR
ncbi:hypothetical protein PybrP1_002123 [[Pythium] brassicae (nom. inval.)]|nr:hypothetical protein PybrP1_002123 [[Pythium] brassicae (nom. inval.)]